MTTATTAIAIHVWLDAPAADERDCDEYYSISKVDADGEEIRCIGGSQDLARAWGQGCERADDLGVPCVEYANEGHMRTDEYVPVVSDEDA